MTTAYALIFLLLLCVTVFILLRTPYDSTLTPPTDEKDTISK